MKQIFLEAIAPLEAVTFLNVSITSSDCTLQNPCKEDSKLVKKIFLYIFK